MIIFLLPLGVINITPTIYIITTFLYNYALLCIQFDDFYVYLIDRYYGGDPHITVKNSDLSLGVEGIYLL